MAVVDQANADRTERSVATKDIQPGMEVKRNGQWFPVVAAMRTSSARQSVSWRTPDGTVDFWVGSPDTHMSVR